MASFSGLCWELKDAIWDLVKQNEVRCPGGKPLSCLSSVCRDWQRNIEPLLYKELCIEPDGNGITTFIKIINYNRLQYLQKLTITFHCPFTRGNIKKKQFLRYLKSTAQQISKVLATLKAVENGQRPHLKLVLKVVQHRSCPSSRSLEPPSLWSNTKLRHSRALRHLDVLKDWTKSLPSLSVVTGLHFPPDFLPLKAMTGFIHQFPNLEDIGVEFLFRHDDKQSWWYAREFIIHDLNPAALNASTVTVTRFQHKVYEEEQTRLRMASGGNFNLFMDTLRECSKDWKRLHLVNFGRLTSNTIFYNQFCSSSHQTDKFLTNQWSQLQEMHIGDLLDYSFAGYMLSEEQYIYDWERDTYAFFTAAGHAAASMPALKEMEICMRITTGWRCAEKCLRYDCKLKEICFGPGIPRSGFRAELKISEKHERFTHAEESTVAGFKADRAATEASWTSSVERTRGLTLRVTWDDYIHWY